MTLASPRRDEVEVSLFGPGYGESVLVHAGEGQWLVVDSCLGADGESAVLSYLRGIDIDPSTAVKLIVATHWHDDHIRGLERLVTACSSARFCCPIALKTDEFLSVAAGLARRDHSILGRSVSEIHAVFTTLRQERRNPVWATANRRVVRSAHYDVWSLSPDDLAFSSFVRSVASLVLQPIGQPGVGRAARRNDVSVALWVRCGDAVLLLGADVEKRGWLAILDSAERPRSRASVFKVPHHGSSNADVEETWHQLLEAEPVAILAPWRLGRSALPGKSDIKRILSHTPHAYASARSASRTAKRHGMVAKTLRSAKVRMRGEAGSPGMVRLRRSLTDEESWRVRLVGSACRLRDFAA